MPKGPIRGDLIVIVPSRGRPDAVAALARRIAETATALTALVVAVDLDDPAADAYATTASTVPALPGLLHLDRSASPAMALNRLAVRYAPGAKALMYLPDTALPIITGWDRALCDTLAAGHGLACGHEVAAPVADRPRHVAMRAEIVTELGYLVPPMMTDPHDWPGVWARWATVTGGMGVADDAVIGRSEVTHRPMRYGDSGWPEYVDSRGLPGDLGKLDRLARAWACAEHWQCAVCAYTNSGGICTHCGQPRGSRGPVRSDVVTGDAEEVHRQ